MEKLLFAPFERANQSGIGASGLGLGLAMAKEFAHMINSDVGAACSDGVGCTFYVDVPC